MLIERSSVQICKARMLYAQACSMLDTLCIVRAHIVLDGFVVSPEASP